MKVQTQPTKNENRKRTNMKLQSIAGIVFALMLVLASSGYAQQKAGVLFQSGLYQEEVKGDLDAAIKVYERIIINFPRNRPVAAKALLHIGLCYEKMGKQEAQKAYQRLIKEYADQHDVAAEARVRLAGMERDNGKTEVTVRRVWDSSSSSMSAYLESGGISRDGRYGAYVEWKSGNLVVCDFTTGTNHHVTKYPGTPWPNINDQYCEVPVISPDGKRIAYLLDGLRVIDMDGSNNRVLLTDPTGFRPYDWSPDGKEILVALYEPRRLKLVSADDGSARVLKTFRGEKAVRWHSSNVNFSPDGHYVAYSDAPENVSSRNNDIFVIDIKTGRETQIIEHPSEDEFVGWASDGRRIVFTSNRTKERSLWMIDVVDGKPQGSPVLLQTPLNSVQRTVRLTRDGSLYYTAWTFDINVHLARLDAAGTHIEGKPKVVNSYSVNSSHMCDWSPDGKRLAYLARNASDDDLEFVIFSVDTGEERILTPSPGFRHISLGNAPWSPDGRSLLVAGTRQSGETGLYTVGVETGAATFAAKAPPLKHAFTAWSPDGKSVYLKKPGIIVSLDLATGRENKLLEYEQKKERPIIGMDVSPDGRWLACSDNRALVVIPAAGGEPREVISDKDFLGKYPSLSWTFLTWTPDGKYLLFTKSQGTELWRVHVESSEQERISDLVANSDIVTLRVHPDGRRIAYTMREYRHELWVMENFLPESTTSK